MKPVRLSKRLGEYYKELGPVLELIAKLRGKVTLVEARQVREAARELVAKTKQREQDSKGHKKKRKPNEQSKAKMALLNEWRKAGKPVPFSQYSSCQP